MYLCIYLNMQPYLLDLSFQGTFQVLANLSIVFGFN